ncbi:hypothetical protein SAMN05444161_5313 [Rhizobiales bacterium GAS191]|nr:hypothetical protein SAMN05444161_5313 [Rhizobiales bacterium GAS191]
MDHSEYRAPGALRQDGAALAHLLAWIDFAENVLSLAPKGKTNREAALLDARYRLEGAIRSANGCLRYATVENPRCVITYASLSMEVRPIASAAALLLSVLDGARLTTWRRQLRFRDNFERAMMCSPDKDLLPPHSNLRFLEGSPAVRCSRDAFIDMATAFLARLAPAAMPPRSAEQRPAS